MLYYIISSTNINMFKILCRICGCPSHFGSQHLRYKTQAPNITLYSSTPLLYLHLPAHNNQINISYFHDKLTKLFIFRSTMQSFSVNFYIHFPFSALDVIRIYSSPISKHQPVKRVY